MLYKGTKHGFKAKNFHNLCDKKKNILVLIKSQCNNFFGGFTKIAFTSKEEYLRGKNILFNLITKIIYHYQKRNLFNN